MRIDVVTLFPDLVQSVTSCGVTGRAVERELLSLKTWNPRDFTFDKHRTVDDRPYGGGPGMLMKVDPLRQAIQSAKKSIGAACQTIYLSPQGERLTQKKLMDLASRESIIMIAGRYEGIDERVIQRDVDEELSIGDFVLSGGELAAMVVIDGIARLLPGALGDAESAEQDSFMDGLLDCPHYTRPEVIDNMRVPEVLLGGNHAQIARWRLKQALGKTWRKRLDLLIDRELSEEQQRLLDEYIKEHGE